MRPDTPQPQSRQPIVQPRAYQHAQPSRGAQQMTAQQQNAGREAHIQKQREAAGNIVRSNLQSVYSRDEYYSSAPTTPNASAAAHPQPQQQSSPNIRPVTSSEQQQQLAQSTYGKTHDNQQLHADPEHWKKYHSAWQNYYQEYFKRYYAGHVQHMQHNLHKENQRNKQLTEEVEATKSKLESQPEQVMTPEDAERELKSELRKKIEDNAKKIKRSRHFWPVTAAICVMAVFAGLQYNRVIAANIVSFISPGHIEPENIIIDPNLSVQVSKEPRIIIPKINVDAPVIYDVQSDEKSQLAAMENGVAWLGIPGANSRPGQIGNTVLGGHSSDGFLNNGNYKFVFTHLEKLQKDDTIHLNYKGTRYTYKVTKKEVILPSQFDVLIYKTDKPMLTVFTCTPLGTSEKRLLVTAEQIHPSTSKAEQAPKVDTTQPKAPLPGNNPTFFEKLFGG